MSKPHNNPVGTHPIAQRREAKLQTSSEVKLTGVPAVAASKATVSRAQDGRVQTSLPSSPCVISPVSLFLLFISSSRCLLREQGLGAWEQGGYAAVGRQDGKSGSSTAAQTVSSLGAPGGGLGPPLLLSDLALLTYNTMPWNLSIYIVQCSGF